MSSPRVLRAPRARGLLSLGLVGAACLAGCGGDDPARDEAGAPVDTLPDFLWGAATAAHQVEGDNHNDWTAWEELGGIDDGQRCGLAADQYRRFDEDFALAAELGHNAHRLSLEWSRIEPQRDVYDAAAIAHYHEVLASLRRHGLVPLVTLHHFSHPLWVLDPRQPDADLGGWLNEATLEEFVEFAGDMAAEFGGEIDWWITINEPEVLATNVHFTGDFPGHAPAAGVEARVEQTRAALLRMYRAHAAAWHAIHQRDLVDVDGDGRPCWVGLAKHIRVYAPANPARAEDVAGVRQLDYALNQVWLDMLVRGQVDANLDGRWDSPGTDPPEGLHPELVGTLDWLGVNYYSRSVVVGAPGLPYLGGVPLENADPAVAHNELGWEIYPAGLGQVLRRLGGEGLPIVVTENGLPDADDRARPAFLVEHLDELQRVRDEGVDVRGYLHWSLLDNFEWTHGFGPRFGLVAVDYETQRRTVRPSARLYQRIIAAGGVSDELRREVLGGEER